MYSLPSLITFAIAFIVKRTCCKILYKNHGVKAVNHFTILSLFLGGSILYCIWGISTKSLLFSIPNAFAWGIMGSSIDIGSLKCNQY